MKIHICIYLFEKEVINFNDVLNIFFASDYVEVITKFGDFYFRYCEFTKIEVDYHD